MDEQKLKRFICTDRINEFEQKKKNSKEKKITITLLKMILWHISCSTLEL